MQFVQKTIFLRTYQLPIAVVPCFCLNALVNTSQRQITLVRTCTEVTKNFAHTLCNNNLIEFVSDLKITPKCWQSFLLTMYLLQETGKILQYRNINQIFL